MPCAASLSSSLLAGEDTWADSGFVATLQCVDRRGSLYGYCIINSAHYAHEKCLTVLGPFSKAKTMTRRCPALLQKWYRLRFSDRN